jgi:hypothetical protein
MYDRSVNDLTETLFTSGAAEDIIARWTELLTAEATDLVAAATIDSDAAAITNTFPVV